MMLTPVRLPLGLTSRSAASVGSAFSTGHRCTPLALLDMLMAVAEFRFRLSWVPRTMSHTACRHAPGSVRHGDGAALRCRYGQAGRWGTPGKVLVERGGPSRSILVVVSVR